MGDVRDYKLREYVRAERVNETGWVNTRNGREFARHGSYLVYGNNGVRLVRGEAFEREYVEVDIAVAEFNPAGKSVGEVVDFMRLNPDEIERVKDAERKGGNRKGILEYRV